MQLLLENRFNIISLLILFGAFNGYIVTVLFFLKGRGKELANRLFAAIMLIFALVLTEMGLVVYGLMWHFPYLVDTTFPLLTLLGPLLYLYTRRITDRQFRLRWIHLWFVTPWVAYLLYWRSWFFLDAPTKQEILKSMPIWELADIPLESYVVLGLILLYTCVFLWLAYRLFEKKRATFQIAFSDNQVAVRIRWFRYVTLFMLGYIVMFTIMFILLLVLEQYGAVIDRAWLLVLSVFVHTVGYGAIQEPVLIQDEEPLPEPTSSSTGKYQKSTMTLAQAQVHVDKLQHYMHQSEAYLNSELSASEVVDQVPISRHDLSQALSMATDGNFYDFVNRFRVEAAAERLCDPAFSHLTVLAIAFDSGFSNKSSFNRYFKKIKGQTPSAYRAAQQQAKI